MNATLPVQPNTASGEQWLAARLELLREEKELTRLRDRVSQRRRELPWVKLTKDYRFESPRGRVPLADLFEGRSQLIVQHFMLGAGWEEGCKSCSFMLDHFNASLVHLQARDVSFAAISHAPLAEILPFKARMGWAVNWVSSQGTDFNRDYRVSFTAQELARGLVDYNYAQRPFPVEEAPGMSVFVRDAAGTVYHTYSTYGRGLDLLMGAYNLLDLVPKGRNETNPDFPADWIRHHDRYAHAAAAL